MVKVDSQSCVQVFTVEGSSKCCEIDEAFWTSLKEKDKRKRTNLEEDPILKSSTNQYPGVIKIKFLFIYLATNSYKSQSFKCPNQIFIKMCYISHQY